MENKFKNFVILKEISEHNNLYIPEGFDWVKDYIHKIPKYDIDLPTITKKSKIHFINKNKNPISIHFMDGSKIFCSYDQFLRLPKNLCQGNELEFKFLGHSSQKDQPMLLKSIKLISV